MDIQELKQHWDKFGQEDPMWAIMTDPEKKGGKWDPTDFYATGKQEIGEIMDYIQSCDFEIGYAKALDFGCGMGRLTQPLCEYFEKVEGVDIAPSMIELANKHNQYPDKCNYQVNEDNLSLFSDGEFDFVYSDIVLQHMEPKYAQQYIKEFLRILKPDGVIIFQLNIPHKSKVKDLIKSLIPDSFYQSYRKLRYGNQPLMEMHGMEKQEVVDFVESSGAKVIDVLEGKGGGWDSFFYTVRKA